MNNGTTIQRYFFLLTSALVVLIGLIVIVYILHISNYLIIFFAVIAVIIIYLLLKLKILNFDFSGLGISIKRYHPLDKRNTFPIAEFPKTLIHNYHIKKIFTEKIFIFIKTENKKNLWLQFSLFGFSKSQIKNIDEKLQQIMMDNGKQF